jgi:two-component system, OmpR family, phosphate regulon sensor histidine kinase PhoR
MGGSLSIPLDFTVEFLLLVVALGAAADAFRGPRGIASKGRALGWLFIAFGQASLGAQIFAGEREVFASLLRGVGYMLLLFLGTRLTRRLAEVPMAAIIVPPATFAFGPAILALGVSITGMATHRRDQEPTSFAYAFAFLTLGISEVVFALGNGDPSMAAVEHLFRGLGALLLARWLTATLARSIRLRFVAAFVVVLAIGILVIGSALNVVIGSTIEGEERSRLATVGRNRVATLVDLEAIALGSANILAQGFRGALEGNGGAEATAREATKLLPVGADVLIVVDRSGRVVAAVERRRGADPIRLPATRSIPLAGSEVVTEARNGREASSPMRISFTDRAGRTINELVLLGAAPVFSSDRRDTIGALAVGYRIDREAVGQIATDTSSLAGLVLGGNLASAASPPGTQFEPSALDESLTAAIARHSSEIERALEDRSTFLTDFSLFGDRYLTVMTPILRTDQVPLGMLVLSTRADALDAARRGLTQTLFLITLLTVLVAGLVAWFGGGRITRPLVSLTHASRSLREGDLSARATVTTEDEVGVLGDSFNAMASDLEAATADLRESVQTETALRARLQTILRSMGDALIATDTRGRITTVNRASEEIFGCTEEDVQGATLESVVHGDGPDGVSLAEAIESLDAGDGLLRGAKGTRLVSFASTPLEGTDGNALGRVIVLRDVTETRQAERMKDEFLANVSHELRTPLTPIMGFAEMMTRREMPREKSAEYLNRILESSQRLERIVDILVDFAAIEAGRMATKNEPVPVRDLLAVVADGWRAREPDRRITTRVARDVRAVLTDGNLMRRSIDELVDNALKFSGKAVSITAEAEKRRNAQVVVIKVADKGPGIPEEQHDNLFSGFHQLDGSETREVGGLGLGLAFVQRAVDYLGGAVELETEVGKGTTVSIVLPAAPMRKTPTRKTAKAGSTKSRRGGRAKTA